MKFFREKQNLTLSQHFQFFRHLCQVLLFFFLLIGSFLSKASSSTFIKSSELYMVEIFRNKSINTKNPEKTKIIHLYPVWLNFSEEGHRMTKIMLGERQQWHCSVILWKDVVETCQVWCGCDGPPHNSYWLLNLVFEMVLFLCWF